jgi:class 3 adenylate cyclase
MESMTKRGYLVLADLSGFTAFLTASELEHAHDILRELIDLVVRRLRTSFELVEVEGDAVYVYAAEPAVPTGEGLLEVLEQTYLAFRDLVDTIDRRSTCRCSACRSVGLLDLKFIVHFGEFILQAVAGGRKPLGSDVNLAHRLLKNSIGGATGWKAYALFTQAALDRAGLAGAAWHRQTETYDSLGAVHTHSLELHGRAADRRRSRAIQQSSEAPDLHYRFAVDLPPAATWEWLNDPGRRGQWEGVEVRADGSPDGVGAVTHCLHGGKTRTVQTILDWQPHNSVTYESRKPGARQPDTISQVVLTPSASGTTVDLSVHVRLRPRWLGLLMYRLVADREYRRGIARLQGLTRSSARN